MISRVRWRYSHEDLYLDRRLGLLREVSLQDLVLVSFFVEVFGLGQIFFLNWLFVYEYLYLHSSFISFKWIFIIAQASVCVALQEFGLFCDLVNRSYGMFLLSFIGYIFLRKCNWHHGFVWRIIFIVIIVESILILGIFLHNTHL